MNFLFLLATGVALIVAVVESQRADNKDAAARYWRRQYGYERQVNERKERRIRRLEIALGRRSAGFWVPRAYRPPANRPAAPSDAELHEWLAATDGAPARYVTPTRAAKCAPPITTGEVRAVVEGAA